MAKTSVGCILKCDDTLVVNTIEHFLRNLDGATVIYFTRNDDHKLYIVDSERARRVFAGGDDGK